jgi:DNA-binding beta-propeller fold protein YncE
MPAPDYGRVWVMGVAPAADRVYVFQRSQAHPMLVFDHAGRFLTSWGAGMFTMPHGCRIGPDGNLWLTDDGDQRVMKFTPDGRMLISLGVRGHASDDRRHFNQPADVAFGPAGDLYVADGYGNARVVHLSPDGRYLGEWGRHGAGSGEFHLVHNVVVGPDRRVYVADRDNRRVQIFTLAGRYVTEWDQVGTPFGLAVTADGRIAVSDGIANTVSLYDGSGRLLTRWGGTGTAPGRFRRAHQIGAGADGSVFVAEVFGRRVQKFVPG